MSAVVAILPISVPPNRTCLAYDTGDFKYQYLIELSNHMRETRKQELFPLKIGSGGKRLLVLTIGNYKKRKILFFIYIYVSLCMHLCNFNVRREGGNERERQRQRGMGH